MTTLFTDSGGLLMAVAVSGAQPARMVAPVASKSVLTEVVVANPKEPTGVRTLELDGAFVAARLVGSTVRIVSSSQLPRRPRRRAA